MAKKQLSTEQKPSTDEEEEIQESPNSSDSESESEENETNEEIEAKTSSGNAQELTEQQLHIEISRLKKTAKASKGKIIQTTVRKAKTLKKGSEKHPKKLQKSESLLQVVPALKKVNAVEVVKFAIAHDDKLCHLLLSKDSTDSHLKAVARIANESSLRQKINQLSSKYNNWSEVVAKFSEGIPIKKKKADKTKKQPVTKTQPSSASKDDTKKKNGLKSTPINSKALVKKSPVKKKIETAVVTKISSLSDLEQIQSDRKVANEEDAVQPTKKDSFFLTSDGSEVLSDKEAESDESEEEFEDKSYKSRKYHVRSANDSSRKSNFSVLNESRTGQSGGHQKHKDNGRDKKFFGNDSNKKTAQMSSKMAVERKEPEKLHPSWEAKRKQQSIQITNAPMNKKIKFD